jgi:hypothetical protein
MQQRFRYLLCYHGLPFCVLQTPVFQSLRALQIRSMISRKSKENDWPPKKTVHELLDERDPNYQPPTILAKYFAAHAAGLDPYSVRDSTVVPIHTEEIDRAAATATQSLLSPQPDQPDFNLLLAIAAGANTQDLSELPTRVPSSPPPESLNLDSEGPHMAAIITDVGGGNESSAGTAAMESALSAMAQAAKGAVMGGAAVTASALEKEVLVRMPQSYGALNNAGASNGNLTSQGPRHVHWGANTENVVTFGAAGDAGEHSQDTDSSVSNPALQHRHTHYTGAKAGTAVGSSIASVSSLTQGPLLLPSLRDPSVSNYLPPPPAGAPSFLRDPLKELLSANNNASSSSARDAKSPATQQQPVQRPMEPADRERQELEESALKGLDPHSLQCKCCGITRTKCGAPLYNCAVLCGLSLM